MQGDAPPGLAPAGHLAVLTATVTATQRTTAAAGGSSGSVLAHNAHCVDAMLDDMSEEYARGKHMPRRVSGHIRQKWFDSDVDLDGLVDSANQCKCHGPNSNGNFERDVNAGTVGVAVGLTVYVEDQNHQRVYAGKEAGAYLEVILRHVDADTLLAGIHLHGDTMFNSPQLMRVMSELDVMIEGRFEMKGEAAEFKSILEGAVRRRGYLWISGD